MEYSLHNFLEREDWLKDLVDNAHDLIQIIHVDGSILYVNQSWLVTLGYTEAEVLGKPIYSFIAPPDVKRYTDYRNGIINGIIANQEIIFDFETKSKTLCRVEGFVSLKLKEGKPAYTHGFFRDITAKVKNEAQLQDYSREINERRYGLEQLLINAPDAVIAIDQDSHITFWNPKAEALFGWSADEVLHRSLSEIIIPVQYRQAHAAGMKRYLATGESHVLNKTIEITALKKGGQEFYVALTIAEFKYLGKTAFVAFLRDVTEQKSNQLALERKTKELEQSNINLQEFAYAASHDLKEPVRKILTFSDRLKHRLKGRLEEEDARYLARMENAANRMNALIEDLLTYSHVSRGASIVEEVDLNKKVALVLEDLELEVQEKQAVITVDTLPVIKGNRRQMQQLFQNLISNALKYHKPGVAPVIHISSQRINAGDAALQLPGELCQEACHLIEVKDNGIGFEQEDAERIFNVFTRLHGNAEYRGSGVGLSIVRKVVENHSGYIWAQSQPGAGTTFKIVLPAM